MSIQVNTQLEEAANLLKGSIRKIFEKEGLFPFDGDPKLEKRDIIEYERRMRASSVDKFNAPAYTAAANFYRTAGDRQGRNAAGVVILSLKEGSEPVIKRAGIRNFDEDDYEVVSEKCGELCEKFAKEFLNALAAAGFPQLIVSEAVHHRNNIPGGVEFSYDQYEEYQLVFHLKALPVMVVDISLAQLPKQR